MAMAKECFLPGSEEVIAAETAISTVSDVLRYRGFAAQELTERATFEEVAYLLLHGELPTKEELTGFQQRVRAAMTLPIAVVDMLRTAPASALPMDTLRTAVSLLASFDPDVQDNSKAANLRKAERLLGQIPMAIAASYRLRKGQPSIAPRSDLGHAANFLYLLHGEVPNAEDANAFDVSLILYADHEFNASTFTARVICSTESDLHSGVVGAIGALKGRLHGGANEKVMDVLRAAGGPDTAETWVREALARKEKIMGFGHRVHKTGDVRAGFLKAHARRAAERSGDLQWEETAEVIERVLAKEKNLFPNVDWPTARLYHALRLDESLYTPFFAAARIAGWCAHIMEQLEHNRILRPRGKYIGPMERAMP